MNIPIAKPMVGPGEIEAVTKALQSGILANGEQTKEFERGWAEWIGVPYAVAMSSGSTALEAALSALKRDQYRDEVIVPAMSYNATSAAVLAAGYRPVFVDILPYQYTIDPEKVEAAVTKKTRAIIPVHLYGLMAKMDDLDAIAGKYDLAIIEDAAQAHDSEDWEGYGPGGWTASIAQCFSFYATKNMTTGGEGGAVTTHDSAFAETIQLLRDHGQAQRYYHIMPGHNWRMTEMQAAFGNVQLTRLEDFQRIRQRNASLYNGGLSWAVVVPQWGLRTEKNRHSWHQYVITVPDESMRDDLRAELHAEGIQTGLHYPVADPMQPMYGYQPGSFPVAERLAQTALGLPVGPWVTEEDARQVVMHVNNIAEGWYK